MSATPVDPVRALHAVTSELEASRILYLVGGSFASTVHGEVRTTADADVVAVMDGTTAERLARSLTDFHVDPELAKTEADRLGRFQALHADSMFRIDIHVVRDTGFHHSELRRATRVELASEDPGLTALIATAEDTVLSKLVWFEKSNRASSRQWSDVLGVIRVQGDRLGWDYMRNWAAELEIVETLEAARLAASI